MVAFNLLPWREYQARQQIKMLLFLTLGTFVLSVFASSLAHWLMAKQIHLLSLKEKKAKATLAKWRLRNSEAHVPYQGNAPAVKVKQQQDLRSFFLNLGKENQTVCFTELSYQKNNITFSGNAYSVYDFTLFLKKWPLASLFDEIAVKKITTDFPFVQFQFVALAKK